jgi:tetratricopeptide (TPR) repeat protein
MSGRRHSEETRARISEAHRGKSLSPEHRAKLSAAHRGVPLQPHHREAIGLYTSPQVRPPERLLNAVSSDAKKKIYSAAKDNASYWVGLLLFDEGKFDSAEDWLSDPRLVGSDGGTWANGTRYNLGRTYEAQGKTAEAIKLYEKARAENPVPARSLKCRRGLSKHPCGCR